jgi:DNA-binding transcriptional LysR family regulator
VTLDDLRVFVATYEAGNLTAVARQIGTTQSAVSQHIRRLERELGVTLFERGRRGVTSTPAGRILLTAATDALGAIDAGRRELDRLRRGDAGTLRVATGGTTLRHFMMEPLAEFRRRHPGITFDYVSAASTRECLDALRGDLADLAFVTIGTDRTLDHRPTVRSPWVLVVSADDPLAGRPSPRPADLQTIRPIGMPQETRSRGQLEEQLASHGVRLSFTATVDDFDTAIRLVELGVGQSIVPALWIHDLDHHPSLRALPITWLPPVTVGWATRHWDALPPYAHSFTQLVNDGLARLGPAARAEVLD